MPASIPTLQEGCILTGPFFNEPMRVETVRPCDDLGVRRIRLHALVKHSTMTALSTQLTPEQIRRCGSKHTSRAMERYLLPEIGETRLVQNTIKRMRQAAEVIPINRNQSATKKVQLKNARSCNYRAKLEAASGFEPENGGFADLCLTTWLCRQKKWSGKRDLNPRLRPWQGRTLPLSYSRSA